MSTTERPSSLSYASAHAVVPISEKRFEQSPYVERWRADDVVFGAYAGRLYPLTFGTDPLAEYWNLRRGVVLFDVPERPLSIKGPDALRLLERVCCRRLSNLARFRARYAIACAPDGGIVMDGVVIRLADDHFWYVQADGDFENWLLAHSGTMDVEITDPGSRVLQIQGPKSLDVLAAASGAAVPEGFGYFHAKMFNLGGQEVLVTRTGWTGELGFEVYGSRGLDHLALWDHLIDAGKASRMTVGAADAMGPRRIEAGIIDNGTDIDRSMTPFCAGLEAFVDFANPDFVGRAALETALRTRLLFGLISPSRAPIAGNELFDDGREVGRITAGDWSPTLDKGVGYVRFSSAVNPTGGWLGRLVVLRDRNGAEHPAEVVNLPFYDAEKRIPRGLHPLSGALG